MSTVTRNAGKHICHEPFSARGLRSRSSAWGLCLDGVCARSSIRTSAQAPVGPNRLAVSAGFSLPVAMYKRIPIFDEHPHKLMPQYTELLAKFRRRRLRTSSSTTSISSAASASSSSTVTSSTMSATKPSIPIIPLNAPSYVPKPAAESIDLGVVTVPESPTSTPPHTPFHKQVQSALANPPKVSGAPSPMLCWVVPAAPMSPPESEPSSPSHVSTVPEPAVAPLRRQPLMLPPIPARNPVNELESEVRELRKQLEELKKVNTKIAALHAA
ncbi:hypothetical protein A1Q2_03232 [Trichosporon asahii var. asahii CBS 8904]|uniref:Uncharacterized protein n=2 Tax=Trichosporon asahii var. asahii TaxID=189963 RepID=K1VSD7_TRIAC|nr:hypothetical protein A1Q2_03232 [Trichosporon asahii var. asahii CBS 8904]